MRDVRAQFSAVMITSLTTGLLLASCSSDTDTGEDDHAIEGVRTEGQEDAEGTNDETGPTPTPTDTIERPEIALPDDMNNVFEDTETKRPDDDAILNDVMHGINAVDMAIAESNPEHPAVDFYHVGAGLTSARDYISGGSDNNESWAGTSEYYDFSIDNEGEQSSQPIVTFCIDRTEVQTKELDTGEILPKPENARNFNYTQVALLQNEMGVWQVTRFFPRDEELDRKCER